MSSAGDMNGFLPTHITDCSRAPTGEVEHDTAHCRNGRILYDETDAAAKRSNAPFFMAVYRQEGDGTNYVTVRNVYMPAVIHGRSEEHTSELQSLMRISYAVFCLKKKNNKTTK